MKTDITFDTIKGCTNQDELAEAALVLLSRMRDVETWLNDARRKAADGLGFAPRDLFRGAEQELRTAGVLMNAVNERRGALRRLAHLNNQAKFKEQAEARKGSKELLDDALRLLFDLYNASYEGHFVEMLHATDCDREGPCGCPNAKTFDKLMYAGGWSARATVPSDEDVAPGS